MAYNVEKNLTHLFVPEKYQFYRQRFGRKKILTQTKSPILPASPPPSPTSKVKWSVPNNPNETSHIPKQLLH